MTNKFIMGKIFRTKYTNCTSPRNAVNRTLPSLLT
uniref:Uncharacterized protein n=1 Tax=Rhizophora mucronata TaxID=61149 RepID=A0A2P2QG54_RHIMU